MAINGQNDLYETIRMALMANYIEDYLELMETDVSLDKDDYSIISSFIKSINKGMSLTDRQGIRAIALVNKYRVDIENGGVKVQIDPPVFRQTPRMIDRRRHISLENDIISVYFPWDAGCIDDIRKYKETNIGVVRFNRDNLKWEFSLNEENLTWVVTWGKINGFILEPNVAELYNKIVECENTPYYIKLVQTETGYTITNAANSLLDYIETSLGGFGADNLTTLVDYAGILGYQIDESITEVEPLVSVFGRSKVEYLSPTEENLGSVLEYARMADRYPIVIYDKNFGTFNDRIETSILKFQNKEDIVCITQNLVEQILYTRDNEKYAKIIITNYLPKMTELSINIPLVVTYNRIMVQKSSISKVADRIIYMSYIH